MDSYTRDFPDNTVPVREQVGDRKAREKMLHAHTLPLLDVLRRLYTYVYIYIHIYIRETAGHEREGAGDHGERTLTRVSCVCGVWCMGSEA